jgi:hypothetical protein
MVLARRGGYLAGVGWNEHGNLGVGGVGGGGVEGEEAFANCHLSSAVKTGLFSAGAADVVVMAAGGAHSGLFAHFY